ncbi:YbhB/YbcL family Raf kinase inhibitor-like protein [Sulfurimonas sp. SAG-AH-194-L11]|nr:YbhB/YbcL family Raf kinase inhibitor-like protein [Sulfurimonas sp. SAG-AH-194-L11]MDF1876215.1 YbhB/YbcL family Raf kinase inhibitor-like protein [Sulfurimonas sp. SAG-AH-194-L11]
MKTVLLLLMLTALSSAGNFTLQSPDLAGQLVKAQEFDGFGCSGKNISPELTWSDAPRGTKSFAVTMYDPDAPTGSGWWHWTLFNIPSSVTSIAHNASRTQLLPKGAIEGTNDYGLVGFGGACPPKGDGFHTYVITLYALDVDKLDLDKSTNQAVVGYMINAHTIAKSSIVSYYKR